MIKVCHIISAFNRYDTRIFVKQCHALTEVGYKVVLLVNDLEPDEIVDNIQIISCNYNYKNRLKRIIISSKLFLQKAIEIDADIYQIHDPELLPLGLKLIKMGKNVVYDAHEDFPAQILEKKWIPLLIRKPLSIIANFYFKKNLNKFDFILSVTPHIVEKLKESTSKVELITNYPIIKSDSISNLSTLEDYSKRGNKLIYAGTIYDYSHQEDVINAIENIENTFLLLVGTVTEKYKALLSKQTSWDKVILKNRVDKNELVKLFSESIIGLAIYDYLPNLGYKKGTLGSNKLFEYMEAGLPVICTDYELWKEIIDKYKCGIYVNPHNIDEIREAILYLINNKEKAYEMGQNGRKAVLEHYNWDTQKEIYLRLYKDLSNEIIAG